MRTSARYVPIPNCGNLVSRDHASTPTFHLSVPFLMPARVTDRQPTQDLTPGEGASGTYKTDPARVRTK
jgi:hypothetical protein